MTARGHGGAGRPRGAGRRLPLRRPDPGGLPGPGTSQPAWSCSSHGSTPEVDRWWVPVPECYRVALVLNGHDHNYQRFVSAGGVAWVVTGGGDRNLYPVGAHCPAGTPRRVAGVAQYHFTAVEIRGRSLTLRAVAADGHVLDQAVIRR